MISAKSPHNVISNHNPGINQTLGYVPALDGLRAIAVILVMLTHANFQLGDNGILGVDVFFALSGFLITTLLLEEYNKRQEISLAGFYLRRSFRLFPALYLMLIAVLAYTLIFKNEPERNIIIGEIVASSLYVKNIAWLWDWGHTDLILLHTWTLAVEEQFYLVWPWFLILALKFKALRLLAISLSCFIVLILILKITGNLPRLGNSLIHESIFIGCLAAILRSTGKINFTIPNYVLFSLVVMIIVVGVFPVPLYMDLAFSGGRSILAIITVIIILALVGKPSGITMTLLTNPLLVGIGKISYGLYIWHFPVFRLFRWHATDFPPSVSFVLKFAISLLLAWASWVILEKRATDLGRRMSKKLIEHSTINGK